MTRRVTRFVGGALVFVLLLAALLWATSRPTTGSRARPGVAPDAGVAASGAAAMIGADFGGLSTDALRTHAAPWRLVAAALVLDARSRDPALGIDRSTLDMTLAGFGFLTQATIVNAPSGVGPRPQGLPLGFTWGDLAPVGSSRVRVANLGCAACHAGVGYAADGTPQPKRAWLGSPNTSIDLEAYTLQVFRALQSSMRDQPALLAAADRLFPEMHWQERASLKWLVLPLVKQRLDELAGVDRPLPFPNGVPGSTNGVPALKVALGVPLAEHGLGESGIVSIPDLGDRVWRTALLADSAYAVPGRPRNAATTTAMANDASHLRALAAITTFFTVPSMGVKPDAAATHLPEAEAIMAFLRERRPQPFPGVVDAASAEAGRSIYRRQCAACHGTYGESVAVPRLVSFPNWSGDVGTDRLRADSFTPALAAAVAKTSYRTRIDAVATRNYAAPPLAGLWASAPYLHNGSVPTLAALLSPAGRPKRFRVGGHALDLVQVGIRIEANGDYPAGYRSFSTPVWIETRAPGLGNGGHDFGAKLTAREKSQLIDYLKLL